jgi:isoleucyl-tRNA synthetase
MLEEASKVEWQPDFVGKRMQDWLTNMGDWCISRKRYWGLPLPFFFCEQCRRLEVAGSIDELRELAMDPRRVDNLPELHRPWIDDVKIKCPGCGAEVSRVREVGDCWLDAGIVPYSTLGYFDTPDAWRTAFPIEWICEMQEQVRLWFYSMLFMGITISDRSPYERVLAYERVVSEDGRPFSKTGFMIHFDEAVNRMGADVMRYLYCSRPAGTELQFGYTGAELAWRKLSGLWNIYAFFVTYALIDRPHDLGSVRAEAYQLADRWLLARTSQMLQTVTEHYERYDTPRVVDEFEKFVDEVSNWYVRLNRRRFWKEGDREDKKACYSALLQCLRASAVAFAPIIPFLTEEIWQNVVRSVDPQAQESVHHVDWPQPDERWDNPDLLKRTNLVREVIRLALHLREQNSLRIRQPLARMFVVCSGPARGAIEEQAGLIQSEVNVKDVTLCDTEDPFRSKYLAVNPRTAGPVLKGKLADVTRELDNLQPSDMSHLVAEFDAGEEVRVPGFDHPLPPSLFEQRDVVSSGFCAESSGDLTVALEIAITGELRREGLARDLVRRLQILRREAGLRVTERIRLALEIEGEDLRVAVGEHGRYIMSEVLALGLADSPLDDPLASAEWTFQGHRVRAMLTRYQS